MWAGWTQDRRAVCREHHASKLDAVVLPSPWIPRRLERDWSALEKPWVILMRSRGVLHSFATLPFAIPVALWAGRGAGLRHPAPA